MRHRDLIIAAMLAGLLVALGAATARAERAGLTAARLSDPPAIRTDLVQAPGDPAQIIMRTTYTTPDGRRFAVIRRLGPAGQPVGGWVTVLEPGAGPAGPAPLYLTTYYDPAGRAVERRLTPLRR